MSRYQLVDGPQVIGIACASPACIGTCRLIVCAGPVRLKVNDQMGDDMCGAGLSRELKVLASERVAIQAQAKSHSLSLIVC